MKRGFRVDMEGGRLISVLKKYMLPADELCIYCPDDEIRRRLTGHSSIWLGNSVQKPAGPPEGSQARV
jgi:hypothetical protein